MIPRLQAIVRPGLTGSIKSPEKLFLLGVDAPRNRIWPTRPKTIHTSDSSKGDPARPPNRPCDVLRVAGKWFA